MAAILFVMINGKSAAPVEMQSIPIMQETVYLRADCDFRDHADTARFYYSLDGKSWSQIGSELKMNYTLPHFYGLSLRPV